MDGEATEHNNKGEASASKTEHPTLTQALAEMEARGDRVLEGKTRETKCKHCPKI